MLAGLLLSWLPAAAQQVPPETADAVTKAQAGPWGEIEYFYIYLEAPDVLMERFPLPSAITRWAVPKMELGDLNKTLTSNGLTNEEVLELLAGPSPIREGDWVYLFPSDNLLLSLPRERRSQLYKYLSQFHPNSFHESPVYFPGSNVRLWAQGTKLAQDKIDLIDRLSFDRGGIDAFSDVPALLKAARGESEARSLYQQLSRTRTLMPRLVITPETDIESLLNYWITGINLRRKEIEPILKSISSTPGARYLDLVHLLPALPRKLLYTYPDTQMISMGLLPDCHWTTLNFFNYSPQDYYLTQLAATSAILENFVKVDPPYRFGDVMMFVNSNGEAVHSCTYIAADIVFTKNGRTPAMPWIFMDLTGLEQMYGVKDSGNRIQGFRHKKGLAPGR